MLVVIEVLLLDDLNKDDHDLSPLTDGIELLLAIELFDEEEFLATLLSFATVFSSSSLFEREEASVLLVEQVLALVGEELFL